MFNASKEGVVYHSKVLVSCHSAQAQRWNGQLLWFCNYLLQGLPRHGIVRDSHTHHVKEHCLRHQPCDEADAFGLAVLQRD